MTLQLLAREGGVARSAMPRLQGRLGLRRIALQLSVSETRDQPPVDAGCVCSHGDVCRRRLPWPRFTSWRHGAHKAPCGVCRGGSYRVCADAGASCRVTSMNAPTIGCNAPRGQASERTAGSASLTST